MIRALLSAWLTLVAQVSMAFSLLAQGLLAQAPFAQAPLERTPLDPARLGPAQLVQAAPDDLAAQLVSVKRVYVDRLTGGETAAQMRDLIISSLQAAKLFVLTENPERADAVLRGAAEDLIYTDSLYSSEGVHMFGGAGESSGSSTGSRFNGAGSGASRQSSRRLNLGVGENETTDLRERKHEALATVRLVNKDGDVIWSTTQESNGAKFRGASADVAEKITRQLSLDFERLRRGVAGVHAPMGSAQQSPAVSPQMPAAGLNSDSSPR
jgi:hypothetical protein